jgi:tRNA threonylcarbamoyladenosine biosynthesis protein TsaB
VKLLALDTSTEFLSLALSLDGDLRVREMLAGQKHSSLILPLLRELLEEAGTSLQALNGIVFGQGPGSFTGLRIGCGVAQGLAFGANLPVVGVTTLLALAPQAAQPKVIACLDARMGEVYFAAYECDGDAWREIHAPSLYHPTQVPAVAGDGWCGIGSGWDSYEAILREKYVRQLREVILKKYPLAKDMLALATPLFKAGTNHGGARMNAVLKPAMPRLRAMKKSDLVVVMAIEPTIYSHPWTRGNFTDSMKSGYLCFAYESGGEMIGYAVMMMVLDEAHLLNVSIAKPQQGQGLGRKLMQDLVAVAQAKKASTMFLEVRPSNKPAIGLYESMDFNEFSVRKGYYPAANGREDAILMGLAL